jgi:hypothetical protein
VGLAIIPRKRSPHVDAPVERVFADTEDPHRYFAAMAPMSGDRSDLTDVAATSAAWARPTSGPTAGASFPIPEVTPRTEDVSDERMVDHSSTGPRWTSLTLSFEYSMEVPPEGEAVDVLAWNGDRDIDAMLASYEREIET